MASPITKSREEKKRVRERFERKLTTIPDSQEKEMEDSQEASRRFEEPTEEYRNTPLQAKFTPAKGSRPLVMVEGLPAVPEMKLATLPPPNGGLEESRWKEARRDEPETAEVLRRMRENRRRHHEDSDGESEDEDEDGEVEEEEEDEEMEERMGTLMKTPNSRRNRAEEVLVIFRNKEVLSDFRNFVAKRTKLAKRNMLAAKANIISAGNMVELNEGLFEGWKTTLEELKYEKQGKVRNEGVKALQMGERLYRRVFAQGEGSRVRRLEK